MLAPSMQELSDAPPTRLRADAISKRGRALTIVMFGCAIALLLLTFAWMGARRINNAFTSRGDAAMQAHDYQTALRDYTWSVRFDRGDAHALLNRGYALQQLNNDQRAIADFARYIRQRPDTAVGYNARGLSEQRLGQTEAAITDFSAAIMREPTNGANYAARARAEARLGQWQAAAH